MKTLVVGLGNPILGDDGVGWRVAELVQARLREDNRYHLAFHPIDMKTVHHLTTVDVERFSLGGLSLMEHLLGYDRVIIVDSMETGQDPIGNVRAFPLTSLPDPVIGHSTSVHDTTLMTALRAFEQLGAEIPKRIDVVAIETQNMHIFTEDLTPSVAAAVPVAVEMVFELLTDVTHPIHCL